MGSSDSNEDFDPISFEKKLSQLNGTQDSIQTMSAWCLQRKAHHKKIVVSWLNVLKRVKIEQRLVLFYLANDVIQYSKRKNYDFVESWGLYLQKATPLVRDERVRQKILRIFKIWEERLVYDEEFLSDLTGLLSAGTTTKKNDDDDSIDFQPQQLVKKIKQCASLEEDTDSRLNAIHECKLDLTDMDSLSSMLKGRRNMDEVENELSECIDCVEKYTTALQREIVAREALLALLTTAHQYYATQRGEVKVVANAYKNFGARVRLQKRKLDELIEKLPEADPDESPPLPETVPSPQPDEDLPLPDDEPYNPDKTFSASISFDSSYNAGGFASFLNTDSGTINNLFKDIPESNGSKIEVISARGSVNISDKQDFSISDFLKTLSSESNPTNNNNDAVDGSTTLPGLDLLSEVPPPTSFYGSAQASIDENEGYSDDASRWSNPTSWPPTAVPPPVVTTSPALVIPVTTVESSGSGLYHGQYVPTSYSSNEVSSLATSVESAGGNQDYHNQYVPTTYTSNEQPADASYNRVLYTEAPASPPSIPPPLSLPPPMIFSQDGETEPMPIPPLPPPPLIPPNITLDLEDVDQRIMPSMPPIHTPTSQQQSIQRSGQDVDHRNLISLTVQSNRLSTDSIIDQDYRLPPPPPSPMTSLLPPSMTMLPPSSMHLPPKDIVEAVDMDLSEEDDEQMYHNQSKIARLEQPPSFNSYYPSKPAAPADSDYRNSPCQTGEMLPNPFEMLPAFENLHEEKTHELYEDMVVARTYPRQETRPRYPPRPNFRPYQQFRPRFNHMPRQSWQPRPRNFY